MPTAGKLAAALLFALLAAVVSLMVPRLLPPEAKTGMLMPVAAALAAVCGWRVSGPRAGQGVQDSLAAAMGSAALSTFATLFAFGAWAMLQNAMRMRYGGPMEAVVAIFEEAMKLGVVLLDPLVLGSIVVGSILCGLLIEGAGRRWP